MSNAYLGQVEDFAITKLQDGRGPVVVVIDGHLSQRRRHGEDWREGLSTIYAANPWYHVSWESKCLHDIGTALTGGAWKGFSPIFIIPSPDEGPGASPHS